MKRRLFLLGAMLASTSFAAVYCQPKEVAALQYMTKPDLVEEMCRAAATADSVCLDYAQTIQNVLRKDYGVPPAKSATAFLRAMEGAVSGAPDAAFEACMAQAKADGILKRTTR